ncbi:MAG: leucine-rich repeat domain-containing protein [Clostridiales bacterium]|nr:leucine-rich repeat domain-containing protein [Clostridiales bacterium]
MYTTIGYQAFRSCSSLTAIVIPEGSRLASIGGLAFGYCNSLTTIVIPEGVTSIGSSAFRGCSSLTKIVIPEGVTSIGERAFSGCSRLTIFAGKGSKPDGWNSSWNYDNRPVYWYSESQKSGNYWRYVDGVPTPWNSY